MQELFSLLVVNGVLELYLLVCPPIVIVVRQVRWFGLRPRAAVFLNLVLVSEASMHQAVLRHEFAHIRQMKFFNPYKFCKMHLLKTLDLTGK